MKNFNINIRELIEKELAQEEISEVVLTKNVININDNSPIEIITNIPYKRVKNTLIFPKNAIGEKILVKKANILQYIKDHNPVIERSQIQKISKKDVPKDLDKYQKEAFEQSIEYNYTSIFGPPGSGKSFIIKNIIEYLNQKEENSKVIITALSNLAIDNILEKLNNKVKIGKADYIDDISELREELKKVEEEIRKNEISLLYSYKIKIREIEEEIKRLKEQQKENLTEIYKIQDSIILSIVKRSKLAQLKAENEFIDKEIKELNAKIEQIKAENRELENLSEDILEIKTSILSSIDENQISNNLQKLKEKQSMLKKQVNEITKNTRVIGITIYSLLKLIDNQKISLEDYTLIIDEASQLPFPVITYLRTLAKRTIVFGDPNQLPPITKTNIPNIYALEDNHINLKKVRRFPKEVQELVQPFYDREIEAVKEGGNVIIIDSDEISQIAKELEKENIDYMIATPYVDRVKYFNDLGLKAETIHKLQGKEFDVVIFDVAKDSQFIDRNMIVVALTRTKKDLIIAFPNIEFKKNENLQKLKKHATKKSKKQPLYTVEQLEKELSVFQ
ncbi:MAG: AAA domain-containing protein [Caldimicrobium sp.]